MRTHALSLIALAVGCSGLQPACAATYYLDGGGSDANAGRTPAEAFRSFGRAMAALHPGDRLIVAAGTYDGPVYVTASGSTDAPIEIAGAPGPRPRIRAAQDAIMINADHIVLSHLDAIGTAGSAIVVEPGHHHVRIEDDVAHDSGQAGISAVQTDYLSILHNRVYGNAATSPWQGSGISLYQAANTDDRPGFHNVIAANIVYDNFNRVPDPKLPPAMRGHTTDGNGIIIDDFRHTQVWMGRTTPAYTAETLVENNVTYRNGGRGIQAFLSDDVTIRNNTCVSDLLDEHLLGTRFGEIQSLKSNRIAIFNNLMVPRDSRFAGVLVVESANVEADYNLVIGGDALYMAQSSAIAWKSHNATGQRAGFRRAEGDSASLDFHLTDGSDARARGDARHAPSTDLDGRTRPPERPADVGAYQFTPG